MIIQDPRCHKSGQNCKFAKCHRWLGGSLNVEANPYLRIYFMPFQSVA